MNKYQKFALNRIKYIVYKDTLSKENATTKDYIGLSSKVVLKQDIDYNINNYYLVINAQYLEKVIYGGEEFFPTVDENLFESKFPRIVVPFNFVSKLPILTLCFKHGIVDNIDIVLEYKETEHEIYDNKIIEENRQKLQSKASIKVVAGNSLINVLFQPATNDYQYSKVELYANNGQLMGKYKSTEDMYFIPISSLAYGSYSIKLTQYDKENNEIFSSDKMSIAVK